LISALTLAACAQTSEPAEATGQALGALDGLYRGHVGGDCFAMYTFAGDRYEGAIECNLGLAHVEHGTYEVSGDVVTLSPHENVCGLLEPYEMGLKLGVAGWGALRPASEADAVRTAEADTDCESDEFATAMGER
jgi:hypothetical protein